MKKKDYKGYIVLGVLFAIFTIWAFIIPFVKNVTFVVVYLFSALAFGYQIYVMNLAFGKENKARSKFYGFPIAKVGIIYLVVQMVLSFVEFTFSSLLPVWVVVAIDILPIGFAVIGSIAADVMRNEIVRQDVEIKTNVNNMRALQSMTASFLSMCSVQETKTVLQEVAEQFKYSDPVTLEETLEAENELKTIAEEIQKSLVDGDETAVQDLCTRIKIVLNERNRVCKLGK